MASYHRVLQVHGRSVKQKSVECDYDIHPWDILINGERWAGKIRLIGFVDSFFLICYSGESRFEQGIVVYKDDDAIRSAMQKAGVEPIDVGLQVLNADKVEAEGSTEPPRYFQFESESGGLDYKITSLGHPISLKTEYPASSLRRYDIKLRKGRDTVMKKRIRRGVSQHDLFDLMHDTLRLGIITHAELIGAIVGKIYGGTALEDVTSKYVDSLVGAKGSKNLSLSGERA